MEYSDRFSQYFFVIKELVSREIKRKYTRSYLGIIWSVLSPLMHMAVMSMIFTKIFEKSIENFPIYYLTGNIFWSMFTGSTNHALTSLVDNKTLLIKVKLPMVVFPLSRCCTELANLGYSMVAYIIMLIVFRIKPNPYMPLFILFAAGLFVFSIGMGYFLSVLYVLFGDIKHLYTIVLTLWMYMSAIFFPVSRTSPFVQGIITRNPIYNYIACARQCVMYGQLPTWEQWARMFIWSASVYILGRLYFKKMQNRVLQKV